MQSVILLSYNTHQKEFFKKITKTIRDKYKTYNLSSDKIFIKSIFKGKKQSLLSGEEISEAINYSLLKFKTRYNMKYNNPIFQLYKRYLFFKSRLLESYLYSFLKNNNINLLIVWNGATLEAALPVCLARKMGIKTLFMENGYFPGTIVMDPQGVNAKNSLPRNKDFYENISIDREKLKKLKATNLEYRKLRGENKLDNNVIEKEIEQLPDKFIFLPFQVHTDTQVLINSPVIKDMEQLLRVVYKGINEFNRGYGDNYKLVVKEHPSDHGRIDYTDLKREYREKGVIFLTKIPMKYLLNVCDMVITLNSTVGIEALLYYKPVLTLGNAFYNIKNIVNNVKDVSRLSTEIYNALNNRINKELIDKFLIFLRYDYLVESGKKDNKRDESKVVDRIIDIIEGEYIDGCNKIL